EEHYFTTELHDAIVVEMKPYFPIAFVKDNEPYRHMEELRFTYKKIIWTWEADGIMSEDSWAVPK
ncbi:MAG: type VI secretion system tube protein Hcp, partial [bacterium]